MEYGCVEESRRFDAKCGVRLDTVDTVVEIVGQWGVCGVTVKTVMQVVVAWDRRQI